MTLLEKMTVCLIVGIASAIGVPSWVGFVNAQTLSKDSEQISLAHQAALTAAKKMELVCQSESYNYPSMPSCTLSKVIDATLSQDFPNKPRLSVLHKLTWEKWNSSQNFATLLSEYSRHTDFLATNNHWVVSAPRVRIHSLELDLLNLASLALLELNEEKTASGKTISKVSTKPSVMLIAAAPKNPTLRVCIQGSNLAIVASDTKTVIANAGAATVPMVSNYKIKTCDSIVTGWNKAK